MILKFLLHSLLKFYLNFLHQQKMCSKKVHQLHLYTSSLIYAPLIFFSLSLPAMEKKFHRLPTFLLKHAPPSTHETEKAIKFLWKTNNKNDIASIIITMLCCSLKFSRAAASDSSSMSKFSSWSCNEDSFADYVVFIIFFMPMWCVKPSNRSAIPSYQT